MAKKKAAKKKVVKKKVAKKKVAKKPAAQHLPGMEDSAIGSLEKLAEEYAGVRDQRMEIGQSEIRLKGEVLSEMKRLKRKRYHRNGITIEVVVEQEGVKVKVKPPEALSQPGDGEYDLPI